SGHPADGAVGGRGRHEGVGPQRRADRPVPVDRGPRALPSLLLGPALREDVLGQVEVDRAARDVDEDAVAGLDEADGPARGRLGRDVADREPARAAGETAVGDEGALLTQTASLEE